MLDILARSAILRAAVGALGGILLVGGAFAAFSGMRGLGIAGAVLGAALTVCFNLAEHRASRGERAKGYSTDALQELWAILDPREPAGPSGYEPGTRVALCCILFAVLLPLAEVGLPFTLGLLHGATGVLPPTWVRVSSRILLPFVASLVVGSTFVSIHRRAFLWREFQRIVITSTIVTACAIAIAGHLRGAHEVPSRDRPDQIEQTIAYWIGASFGIAIDLLLLILISLALCGAGYLLVNAVSRKVFAAGAAAREDDDGPWR